MIWIPSFEENANCGYLLPNCLQQIFACHLGNWWIQYISSLMKLINTFVALGFAEFVKGIFLIILNSSISRISSVLGININISNCKSLHHAAHEQVSTQGSWREFMRHHLRSKSNHASSPPDFRRLFSALSNLEEKIGESYENICTWRFRSPQIRSKASSFPRQQDLALVSPPSELRQVPLFNSDIEGQFHATDTDTN